jgi:membrane protein implicated in regulation of membrane protease activity
MSNPAPRSPFIAPAWIAAASLLGLVSALIGDGVFDVISWLVFSALVALVIRAWVKRTR